MNKIPYFELKVVKVKKEKKFEYAGSVYCKDCKKYIKYNFPYHFCVKSKGNWVNGENLDKIKFPCFCSYTHGSKKVGILSKLGNSFYIINIGGQGDYNKYFLSYDLKHLIEDFNIHILKGKIIIFEEEEK